MPQKNIHHKPLPQGTLQRSGLAVTNTPVSCHHYTSVSSRANDATREWPWNVIPYHGWRGFFFAEVVHVFGNLNCGFFAMVFFWGPWGLACSMGVE